MGRTEQEEQFREWTKGLSNNERADRWAEELRAMREAEEKEAWIARRKAQARRAQLQKLRRILLIALPAALLLAALGLLGIPAYSVYRARSFAEAGNDVLAEEQYRKAAEWSLFDRLFHPGDKADAIAAARELDACTAGVSDGEIPKNAVRLTGSAQGRNGTITVELIADSERLYRVSVTEHRESEGVGAEAAHQMPGRIYRAQSVAVDAVSGATISSQAICRAAAQALGSDAAWKAGIYPWRFGGISPLPDPVPTMGPAPEEIKVFFYDNELEEFTEVVGESVRVKAVAYPEELLEDAVFEWTVSEPGVLKLTVSDDSRSCVVLCQRHMPGGVDLIVTCNGVSRTIHVYTRN